MIDNYSLFQKLRKIHREDKNLQLLEKEQLRTIRELSSVLQQTKEKISRRQQWLELLDQRLTEGEQVLLELQSEYLSLMREALDLTAKHKEKIGQQKNQLARQQEEVQATQAELSAVHTPVPAPSPSFTPPAPFDPAADVMQIPELKVQWFPSNSGGKFTL